MRIAHLAQQSLPPHTTADLTNEQANSVARKIIDHRFHQNCAYIHNTTAQQNPLNSP